MVEGSSTTTKDGTWREDEVLKMGEMQRLILRTNLTFPFNLRLAVSREKKRYKSFMRKFLSLSLPISLSLSLSLSLLLLLQSVFFIPPLFSFS
jgi:hypothetical protein